MSEATARAGEDEAAENGLATKRDLRELKKDLKDDLRELKADIKDDLREFKADVKDDLKEIKDGLKADRKELKADIIKVAGIVVGALASAGIIAAAIVGLMQALT